jgi:hypothetical protein
MREITRKYGKTFLVIMAALVALAAVSIRFGFTNAVPTKNVLNKRLPDTILWAWERPEDLSFLNPGDKIGVAYLAKTLSLRKETVAIRPRFQPVKFPSGATLIAVVRIESDDAADLSQEQRVRVASEISELAHQKNITAVQIDFDAKQSERNFYRNIIFDLRRDWPSNIGLSITALASWCISDTWIKDLPVDEAVPMTFRMGADNNQVRMHLKSGGDFNIELCRDSIGISTDETIDNLPTGRRVYIFNPRSWNQQSVNKALSIASGDQSQ